MFDINKVRNDFPFLNQKINDGYAVYLDNAASSQKPRSVVEEISRVYHEEYANVHRGIHYLSMKATENFEDARTEVANFLNSQSENQIIFTKNATEAINLVASSFGAKLEKGDEVIISILEHHSNIVPWHFLRERIGVLIKWVNIDENGCIDVDHLKSLITNKTKIISVTHMSNVLGTVQPLKEIIDLAHQNDVPVMVDGTQGAVHNSVDVRDLDVDFYVFTGHKLYGPSGIGVLYAKKEQLDSMAPYQGGGEMIAEVTKDSVIYADAPQKFEENRISDYTKEKLVKVEGINFLIDPVKSSGIFSFTMDGAHPHDVSTIIDRKGVAIRAGTHCAEPLLQTFKVTSTCRASIGMYNNEKDIDNLYESLLYCRKFFS